jgi:hypothetical protein
MGGAVRLDVERMGSGVGAVQDRLDWVGSGGFDVIQARTSDALTVFIGLSGRNCGIDSRRPM